MWEEGARIYDTPRVHNNFPEYDSLSYDTESPRVGGGWKCVVSFFSGFFLLASPNSPLFLTINSITLSLFFPLQLWSLKRIPERNNKLRVSLFVQLVALHVLRESHWILLYFANITHRPSIILSLYLHIKPLSSHCYTLSLLLFFHFPFEQLGFYISFILDS